VLAIRHKNKRLARIIAIQKLQDCESKILRILKVLNKSKWFRGLQGFEYLSVSYETIEKSKASIPG
jgi:hypothetical protein